MAIKICPACGIKNQVRQHNINERPICGRCGTSLDADPTSSPISYKCMICGYNGAMESLSNGRVYHKQCQLNLTKSIEQINSQIWEHDLEVRKLKSQLEETNSLAYIAKAFFIGNKIDVVNVNKQIRLRESSIQQLSARIKTLTEPLFSLYTFWLTYPPDWDERCSQVRLERGRRCADCGSSRYVQKLHVHHRVPISKGGNHALYNLVLLCESCHSRVHGNRIFPYSDVSNVGAFGKRLTLLQNAVSSRSIVHFHYRKDNGQKSVRSIRPEGFENFGDLLCVYGHCYLRNARRTFAVKRMNNAQAVNSPGRCYDK